MVDIVHLSKTDFAERTMTGTTPTELTDVTISWASLVAAGFSGGDEVLILLSLKQTVNTNNGNSRFYMGFGTTFAGRVDDADSYFAIEPFATNVAQQHTYYDKRTLVANENIYFSHYTGSATHVCKTTDFVFLILKTADLGSNLLYQETNPESAGDSIGTMVDAATVTTNASSDWLVFGCASFDSGSTTYSVTCNIKVDGVVKLKLESEGEDINDWYTLGGMVYCPSLATGKNIIVQFNGQNIHVCKRTSVVAINLSAFESHDGVYLTTNDLFSLDNTYEQYFSDVFTPTSTGNCVVFGCDNTVSNFDTVTHYTNSYLLRDGSPWGAAGDNDYTTAPNLGAGGHYEKQARVDYGYGSFTGSTAYTLSGQNKVDWANEVNHFATSYAVFSVKLAGGGGGGGGAALAGNAAATLSAGGALDTAINVAGAGVSVATAGGALDTAINVAGAGVSVATAGGALSTGLDMAGVATAISFAGGDLTVQIKFQGAAISQALASGGLIGGILLAGSAAGQASASGNLSAGGGLAGNAAAIASASGGLTVSIQLSGAAISQALSSGNLSVGQGPLAGDSASLASAAGSLSSGINLVVTAQAYAAGGGALTNIIQLAGAAASIAGASGNLQVQLQLSGDAIAQTLAAGDLTARIQLDAQAVAQAVAAGALTGGSVALPTAPARIVKTLAQNRTLQTPYQNRTLKVVNQNRTVTS